MGILSWLRSIIGDRARKAPSSDGPSDAHIQAALACLDRMVKPAIFADLGDHVAPDGRIKSLWGGGFFGAADEAVPVSSSTGQPMRPLVQIRMDELPQIPACFTGVALLTLWLEEEAVFAGDEGAGAGFVIRTYTTLDDLVPIGAAASGSKSLPILPITWRAPVLEQPHWDDIVGELPDDVAEADEDEWFFASRYAVVAEELYETCPVKLGGWPSWIQNSAWPVVAEFAFQINATNKGKLDLGDGGSVYFFRTARGWVSRADCY